MFALTNRTSMRVEYRQLCVRISSLTKSVEEAKESSFRSKEVELAEEQLTYMYNYKDMMEKRAKLLGWKLTEEATNGKSKFTN